MHKQIQFMNSLQERIDDHGLQFAKNDGRFDTLERMVNATVRNIGNIGKNYQTDARTAAWGAVGIVASLAAGLLTYRLTTDCWKSSGMWDHIGCWGNHVFHPASDVSAWNLTINTIPLITTAASIYTLTLGAFRCISNSRAFEAANKKLGVLVGRLNAEIKNREAAEAAAKVRDQAFADQLAQLQSQQILVSDVILGVSTLGTVGGIGFCVAGPIGSIIGVAAISLGTLIISKA